MKCPAQKPSNTEQLTTIPIARSSISGSLISKYILIVFLIVPALSRAQERPGVFFKKDYKETPAEIPVSQGHIANPNLLISLYGTVDNQINKSRHEY